MQEQVAEPASDYSHHGAVLLVTPVDYHPGMLLQLQRRWERQMHYVRLHTPAVHTPFSFPFTEQP